MTSPWCDPDLSKSDKIIFGLEIKPDRDLLECLSHCDCKYTYLKIDYKYIHFITTDHNSKCEEYLFSNGDFPPYSTETWWNWKDNSNVTVLNELTTNIVINITNEHLEWLCKKLKKNSTDSFKIYVYYDASNTINALHIKFGDSFSKVNCMYNFELSDTWCQDPEYLHLVLRLSQMNKITNWFVNS
jgi:hypothetical protein